jgi:DNA repair photolyase
MRWPATARAQRLQMSDHHSPLPSAHPLKGRGTPIRIAHRFERVQREVHDDGWGTLDQLAGEEHLPPQTQIIEERAKSILAANDSPDLPFELSINPYRGCEHGCIYCYARPTHSYLNLSPGLDFETKIIAKVNAAERLREALAKPGYVPKPLNLGSATDAYQPIERQLGITRAVVELLAQTQHPFSVVTKSGGIVRDVDLYASLAARGQVVVFISITTLLPDLHRILEPRASAPARRLAAVKTLAEAGVHVGVNVAPIIPFINEPEIEQIIEAAAQAGAKSVHYTVLRLPWEVNPLFAQWLAQHFPERAARVMARVREMRGGRDYNSDFRTRMKGEGLWAQLIAQRVAKAAARAGLTRQPPALDFSAFTPPRLASAQGELF